MNGRSRAYRSCFGFQKADLRILWVSSQLAVDNWIDFGSLESYSAEVSL
jgi:hypothetical protein